MPRINCGWTAIGPTGENSSVWPTGRARAASAVPIVPLAPMVFLTTTWVPRAPENSGARMRATMSAAPPGAKVTTMVMGACARAGGGAGSSAAATRAPRAAIRLRIGKLPPEAPAPGRLAAGYRTGAVRGNRRRRLPARCRRRMVPPPSREERMGEEQPLLVRREGPVVRAVMNRPERRNALSMPMGEAWDALLDALRGDQDARVLVISGAGGHFCAGLDLTEVAGDETPERKLARQQARNRRTGARFAELSALPQVVVAA